MAYTEVLTSHGVTVSMWEDRIAAEYIGQLWMKNIMGPSQDAVIQVKSDLTKMPGDAINFGIRSQMKGGYVAGNAFGLGNEGRVEFYNQRTVIDNVRHLVRFDDVPMSQKRVGWDLLNQGREALVEKARIRLDEDIIAGLSVTSTGRVRGRYLYGAVDSNWNATHTTALTNVDNTADQATTNGIRICKRKSLIPVNATARIRPMNVKVGMNFEQWFICILHPYCVRDLVDNDAAYRNAQLLLPPSGNRESPLFTGNAYRGAYDGVLIYEYDRINLVASTIQVAHNLFLGAQAGVVAWGQMPKFNEQEQDLGHTVTYEVHEIRKVDKVVYDRATIDASLSNEDNGIIHYFAAAVAD
jgi:N4-gp56 family major capsid protein